MMVDGPTGTAARVLDACVRIRRCELSIDARDAARVRECRSGWRGGVDERGGVRMHGGERQWSMVAAATAMDEVVRTSDE